jgi:hypothetical protein
VIVKNVATDVVNVPTKTQRTAHNHGTSHGIKVFSLTYSGQGESIRSSSLAWTSCMEKWFTLLMLLGAMKSKDFMIARICGNEHNNVCVTAS